MASLQEQHQANSGPPASMRRPGGLSQARRSESDPMREAYGRRLEFLMSEAEAEGIVVKEGSVREFWSFIGSFPVTRKGPLFLTDEGNLSTTWDDWDDEGESSIWLEFLGDGVIRHVILEDQETDDASSACGDDGQEAVTGKIRDLGLEFLLTS